MARKVHRRDRRQIDPAINPANAPCFLESLAASLGPSYVTVSGNVSPSARITSTSDPAALADWFVLCYIMDGMGVLTLNALPATALSGTGGGGSPQVASVTADFGSTAPDLTKPWAVCIPLGQNLIQSDFGGPVFGGAAGFGPVGTFGLGLPLNL